MRKVSEPATLTDARGDASLGSAPGRYLSTVLYVTNNVLLGTSIILTGFHGFGYNSMYCNNY